MKRFTAKWLIVGTIVLLFSNSPGRGERPAQYDRAGEQIEKLQAWAMVMDDRQAGVALLIRIAESWALLEPARVSWLLARAHEAVLSLEEEEARLIAWRLQSRSFLYPADMQFRIRELAARVLAATRPFPLSMVLLRAAQRLTPGQTDQAVELAIRLARQNQDPFHQALELRLLAATLVQTDESLAMALAEAIRFPEVSAWAFRSMGLILAEGNPEQAGRYFSRALGKAWLIPDRLVRIKEWIKLAEARAPLDWEESERLLAAALEASAELETAEEYQEAISLIGAFWGGRDYRKAFEMAALTSPDSPEAGFYIYLNAAEEAADRIDCLKLLAAAEKEALDLADVAARDRALAWAAVRAAAVDIEVSLRIRGKIGPNRRLLRSNVLAVIISQPGLELTRAYKLTDDLEELLAKGLALCYLARRPFFEDRLSRRQEGLVEAGRLAFEIDSDRLRSETALAWALYSDEKALNSAALIKQAGLRAETYGRIAGRLKEKGPPGSWGRALKLAINTADSIGREHNIERAGILVQLAELWAESAPGKAALLYQEAYRLLVG